MDLWERLLPLIAAHDVRYHWVKGHAENEYNNRCDEARRGREPEIQIKPRGKRGILYGREYPPLLYVPQSVAG